MGLRAASATPLAMSANPLQGVYGTKTHILSLLDHVPYSVFWILLPKYSQAHFQGSTPRDRTGLWVYILRPTVWPRGIGWQGEGQVKLGVCLTGVDEPPWLWDGAAWREGAEWISLVFHLSTQIPRTLGTLNSRLILQDILRPYLFRYKDRTVSFKSLSGWFTASQFYTCGRWAHPPLGWVPGGPAERPHQTPVLEAGSTSPCGKGQGCW